LVFVQILVFHHTVQFGRIEPLQNAV
jgi:hypothetical protein